ncbi:MAG TPA: DUF6265 family protein [Casimicrobiaceae bacterium]|nr:DUF6265 family protein [Casimicrobiaceae bacterium]
MTIAACAKLEAPPVAGAPSSAASESTTSTKPPSPPPSSESAPKGGVADLAWLAGCWQNTVNGRELREEWLPLRGGMLVGAAQQTMQGAVQDYEFLRIDSREGSVHFTQFGAGGKEISFRLSGTTTDGNDTIFTFDHTTPSFPARLLYRRGEQGWLYETVEGRLGSGAKRVVYPLRRVDCETGELIAK